VVRTPHPTLTHTGPPPGHHTRPPPPPTHTHTHTPRDAAEGAKAEAAYAKDGTLPDPNSTTNPEFKIVLGLIKDGIPRDPTRYTRMAKRCKCVAALLASAWVGCVGGCRGTAAAWGT
jgi:hypothetical protein